MIRAASLLAALVAAGCVVPRKAGFDDVAKSLRARTPYRVHWNQGSDEDRRVAEETRWLLSQELTVETATQVALFNNPELQATYERLGVAQAEVVQAGLLRNPKISLHWGFRIVAAGLDEIVGSVTGAFLDLILMPLKKKLANAEFRRVKLEVADAVLAKVDASRRPSMPRRRRRRSWRCGGRCSTRSRRRPSSPCGSTRPGTSATSISSNEQAVYTQAKLDLGRAAVPAPERPREPDPAARRLGHGRRVQGRRQAAGAATRGAGPRASRAYRRSSTVSIWQPRARS